MIHSFSKDEIICEEGGSCENAFILLSGKVEVIHKGESRIAGVGEIFGAKSLIRGESFEDTVIARASATIDLLALPDVEKLLSRVPITNTTEPSTPATHTEAGPTPAKGNNAQSDMGPIASLINDDSINDILINGCNSIYVERSGILEKTGIAFSSDDQVYALANNIVKDIGRKIDRDRPLVDARLLDGSRVNIIAPPLAVDGTSISIRKFSKRRITLDSMVENGNMNREVAEFLKVAGKCRLNIVISGGTGSGKTTLLNAISEHIDKEERVVTIEDAAELKLLQPHVVRLETRPHHVGMHADEDVSIRDLVRNALRMRPDRIIVGEVRGAEAFDMLQAMNSGHEGSLTTIHANHPRDALSRLENMISMTDLQIPMKSLRYQIASALHLIVQISRMRDGHRRITFVSEVVGMEGDMITMHDLFNFKAEGEDAAGRVIGKFKWSGIMPRFVRRIEYYGDIERLENALGVKFPKAVRLGKQA